MDALVVLGLASALFVGVIGIIMGIELFLVRNHNKIKDYKKKKVR